MWPSGQGASLLRRCRETPRFESSHARRSKGRGLKTETPIPLFLLFFARSARAPEPRRGAVLGGCKGPAERVPPPSLSRPCSSHHFPVPAPAPRPRNPEPARKGGRVERRKAGRQVGRGLLWADGPRRRRPRREARVARERVVGAGKDAQLARAGCPQVVLGQHAVHGAAQRRARVARGDEFPRRGFFQTSRVPRVPFIFLLVPLAAREGESRGVDDDDDVSSVGRGVVRRLVLALSEKGWRVSQRVCV